MLNFDKNKTFLRKTRKMCKINDSKFLSVKVNEPVAEVSGEKAEDNAEGDIEPEHQEVS